MQFIVVSLKKKTGGNGVSILAYTEKLTKTEKNVMFCCYLKLVHSTVPVCCKKIIQNFFTGSHNGSFISTLNFIFEALL